MAQPSQHNQHGLQSRERQQQQQEEEEHAAAAVGHGSPHTRAATSIEDKLRSLTTERASKGLLRTLTHGASLADFSSNDYLGFSRSLQLHRMTEKAVEEHISQQVAPAAGQRHEHGRAPPALLEAVPLMGSTGSRLLSGNSALYEEIEAELAAFHGAPAGIIFNSGFDANSGFFACVTQKEDVIFYDELIHASVHEGMRLGRARTIPFKHNDVAHLRQEITAFLGSAQRSSETSVLVAVESLYSMDGDIAPLVELAALCQDFGAHLVVDEAHATGVFGPRGGGLVQHHGLEGKVFARLHTFGKALGCHGAILLGSAVLRTYLINYARPLIYSTSLPLHSLMNIRCAYQLLRTDVQAQSAQRLNGLIERFRRGLDSLPPGALLPSSTAIQGVIIPGNAQVVQFARKLQAAGFDIKPIRSPTVPAGTERIRICIHVHNSEKEIDTLCRLITELKALEGGGKLARL